MSFEFFSFPFFFFRVCSFFPVFVFLFVCVFSFFLCGVSFFCFLSVFCFSFSSYFLSCFLPFCVLSFLFLSFLCLSRVCVFCQCLCFCACFCMCETLGYVCVSMCMGLPICLYVGIYQDFLFVFVSAGRRAPGGNATVAVGLRRCGASAPPTTKPCYTPVQGWTAPGTHTIATPSRRAPRHHGRTRKAASRPAMTIVIKHRGPSATATGTQN